MFKVSFLLSDVTASVMDLFQEILKYRIRIQISEIQYLAFAKIHRPSCYHARFHLIHVCPFRQDLMKLNLQMENAFCANAISA